MRFTLLIISFFIHTTASAYQNKSYFVGLAPSSFGLFNKVTSSTNHKTSTLGTIEYLPLTAGLTFTAYQNWFVSPNIVTTYLIPTKLDAGTEKKFMALFIPFGKNFSGGGAGAGTRSVSSQTWDWNFAPGIYMQELKGSGGTYTDPLGAVSYYPSSSTSSKLYTLSGGVGYESGHFRFSSNLVVFDALSSNKRALNLFLSFCWMGGL